MLSHRNTITQSLSALLSESILLIFIFVLYLISNTVSFAQDFSIINGLWQGEVYRDCTKETDSMNRNICERNTQSNPPGTFRWKINYDGNQLAITSYGRSRASGHTIENKLNVTQHKYENGKLQFITKDNYEMRDYIMRNYNLEERNYIVFRTSKYVLQFNNNGESAEGYEQSRIVKSVNDKQPRENYVVITLTKIPDKYAPSPEKGKEDLNIDQ